MRKDDRQYGEPEADVIVEAEPFLEEDDAQNRGQDESHRTEDDRGPRKVVVLQDIKLDDKRDQRHHERSPKRDAKEQSQIEFLTVQDELAKQVAERI